MSYKTNPIANRLKLTKGWKNSLFPTKRLNYSRNVVLWFKLYLFLKTYLALRKIKLLSCEMRLSETNTWILYLSISKIGAKKRRNNPKLLSLKKIGSPLRQRNSKLTKYWLYQQNLSWLKQISVWQQNIMHRKSLSKLWISKPRLSSWINLTAIIQKQRYQSKLFQKNLKRKKKLLTFNWRKFKNVDRFLIQTFKANFWLLKQKKLLSLFSRIQKDIVFLQKQIFFLKFYKKEKSVSKRQHVHIVVSNLFYKLVNKRYLSAEIYKLYLFLYQQNFSNDVLIKQQVSSFRRKIVETQTKHNLNFLWKIVQRQIKCFALKPLLVKQIPARVLHLYSSYFNATLPYQFLMPTRNQFCKALLDWYFLSLYKMEGLQMQFNLFKISKRNFSLRTLCSLLIMNGKTKNFDVFRHAILINSSSSENVTTQEKERYTVNYFLKKMLKKKNCTAQLRISKKVLKSRIVPKSLDLFYLIRFQQKIKLNVAIRKHRILRLSKRKEIRSNYRIPYRQSYLQNLKFLTTYKLKFLIQELIQQYFALKTHVKILWPLNQFKNFKFYRLVFPSRSTYNRKKRNISTIKHSNLKAFGKKYIYISQMTNHLEIGQMKQKSFEESTAATKYLQMSVFNKQRNFLNNEKYISAPTSWTHNLLIRNAYLYEKWKNKQRSKQNVLSNFNRRPFIKSLVSSLILVTKYLDSQLLADELAKIIKHTKKHRWLLNDIHTILKRLPLTKGLGYKIVLIGRINGARKTRLVSLAKFNRYRSQQTFSKNVNFAMTQTTASIGTFGIKVWLYY